MKKLTFILLMAVSAKNFGQSDVNISNLASLDGEPHIAINPTNSNNIIAGWMRHKISDGLNSIATSRSLDGGQNWSPINFIARDTNINQAADVTIAFHNSGVAYLSCINFRLDSGDVAGAIFLSKSIDSGLTWSVPNRVIGLGDSAVYPFDRPWMAIDNNGGNNDGTVYITTMSALLVTEQPGQVHIYLRSSSDGGNTWSPIKQVDDSSHSAGSLKVSYGAMSVGGDGTLYIAYMAIDTQYSPVPRFYVATTTDAGNTFQRYLVPGYVLSGAGKIPFYTIAADPINDGHVILSWCDTRWDARDILRSKSIDSGQTWSPPLRVNDDMLGNDIVQNQVWSAFSSTGKFALAWRDSRLNNTSDTSAFDIYTAVSLDGGTSFLPNYRLSSSSYPNPTIPCCNSFNGLALTDSILVADWGGWSGSSWDIYFNKQDISTITTGIKENLLADNDFNLQTFPNPANSETIIQFTLPQNQFVELKLMNVRGEEIKSLIKNELIKGKHSVTLDTKNFSQGIYFIKLMPGKTAVVEKLIVTHATQK